MKIDSIGKIRDIVFRKYPDFPPFEVNSENLDRISSEIHFSTNMKFAKKNRKGALQHLLQQCMLSEAIQALELKEDLNYLEKL